MTSPGQATIICLILSNTIIVIRLKEMKSLYLLLDEWDNDRNFVGNELTEISKNYDVTVICNSASDISGYDARFLIYNKPGKSQQIVSLIKFFFDRDVRDELKKVIYSGTNIIAKISEILHFYINADLFRRYLRKENCLKDNAIYYSYWYYYKCYAITKIMDKFSESKVITRTHGYDLYDDRRTSGYQPFKEQMDDKLDKIIFISEYGRDYYFRRYNRKPSEKYILNNLGTHEPKSLNPYMKHDNLRLVSCSHMIKGKRIHLIIEALGKIDDIAIEWIHFGSGILEDKLKRQAKDLLSNKINIRYDFRGQVKNKDIHEFYLNEQVDAFITSSESEGNPVSVMEAMSYGVPIIAPAICNFPAMLEDCGMLVPEESTPDELASMIMKLADMTEKDTKIIRNNIRSVWEKKYDGDKNIRFFVEKVLGEL